LVLIVNVAKALPPTTVTVVGTVATLWLLDRLTKNPTAGAGPVNVTVPVTVAPPFTDVELRVNFKSVAGEIKSTAESTVPFRLATMAEAVWVSTATVLIVNVALDFPAAIFTEPGTVAATSPLPRVTTRPPVGAGPERVTVPIDDVPPITVDGCKVTDSNVAGLTVRVAVSDTFL